MKKALVLALAALLAGCGSSTPEASPPTGSPRPSAAPSFAPEVPGPGDHRVGILVGGEQREFEVHAPPGFTATAKIPLVLVFHGSGSSPDKLAASSGMNKIADSKGFLVVYPRGSLWSANGSKGATVLLDHLTAKWSIDVKRVYSTGFSAGANASYLMAQDLPGRVAAIGPVSGAATELNLTQPIPLITFQGGRDTALTEAFASANAQWREKSGCGTPAVASLEGFGSATVRHTAVCSKGQEHVVYAIAGLAHAWPSEASPLLWEFFARFQLA